MVLTLPASCSSSLSAPPGGFGAGARLELVYQHVAALALDERQEAVFAPPHHRVDLPMAELDPPLHGGRALLDSPFARQSSTAVVASIAFAPGATGDAQVLVK